MGEPIVKSVAIAARAEAVWDTLTNPARIPLWLSDAQVSIQSDWTIGAPMAFTGEWHGLTLADKGDLIAFDKPRPYAYRHWSSLSEAPDVDENYTTVRFELNETDGVTTLSLHQASFISFESRAHWNFYWSVALDRIRRLTEAPDSPQD
jgi:uncharacterized protein YndB with AHSA1/START domain